MLRDILGKGARLSHASLVTTTMRVLQPVLPLITACVEHPTPSMSSCNVWRSSAMSLFALHRSIELACSERSGQETRIWIVELQQTPPRGRGASLTAECSGTAKSLDFLHNLDVAIVRICTELLNSKIYNTPRAPRALQWIFYCRT